MVDIGIPPFEVIVRKLTHGFYKRIESSTNTVISVIFNSMVSNKSLFLKRYLDIVYFNHSMF